MLLFIKEPDSTPDKNPGFQNIVCYCLSWIALINNPEWEYFKTSYVTVYLYATCGYEMSVSFQNIVCYCLSDA